MKHAVLIAAVMLAACSPTKPADTPAASLAQAPASTPTPGDPSPTTAANPIPNAAEDACNKSVYAGIIGLSEKDPQVPPAGPKIRRIHPGDQVTMDARSDRLNIDIDAKGVVIGLRCG